MNSRRAHRIARLELQCGVVRGTPQQRHELAAIEAEIDAMLDTADAMGNVELVQAAFRLHRLTTRSRALRDAMKTPADRRAEAEADHEQKRRIEAMSVAELEAAIAGYQPERSGRDARMHDLSDRGLAVMGDRDIDEFIRLLCE
jgi:hypothetical protein